MSDKCVQFHANTNRPLLQLAGEICFHSSLGPRPPLPHDQTHPVEHWIFFLTEKWLVISFCFIFPSHVSSIIKYFTFPFNSNHSIVIHFLSICPYPPPPPLSTVFPFFLFSPFLIFVSCFLFLRFSSLVLPLHPALESPGRYLHVLAALSCSITLTWPACEIYTFLTLHQSVPC